MLKDGCWCVEGVCLVHGHSAFSSLANEALFIASLLSKYFFIIISKSSDVDPHYVVMQIPILAIRISLKQIVFFKICYQVKLKIKFCMQVLSTFWNFFADF